MQYDTTNRRGINRRAYLRVVSVGALATGLAGCLGAEAEDSSSSNSDSGNTTAGNGAQGSGTETDTSTDAGGGDSSDGSESSSTNCEDLNSELTTYDTGGTPFVFAFDYPDGWDQPDTQAGGPGVDSITGTSIKDEDGSMNRIEFQIRQLNAAVGSAEASDQIEKLLTEGDWTDRSYEELDELDFAGETIQVAGSFEDEDDMIYQLYLPYEGSDGGQMHYPVEFGVVLRSASPCTDTIRELSEKTLRSFRPNPDSTIDSVGIEED